METRYALRKTQLLEECQVAPEIFAAAGRRGTMRLCDMRCATTSRRTWDQPMACWGSSPRGCRHPVGNRGEVARQWGGRLGKVDNGHVAISLGYVSRQGQPLVDTRRYRPQAWTQETARLDKAGVPQARRGYRRRHPLAWEMLAHNGVGLPHGWIAGDDERGRPYWFRRRLAAWGAR